MKKTLFAVAMSIALWESLCLAQAPFSMADDGQWKKADYAHRLSEFPKVHPDGRVWFQYQTPRTAQSVRLHILNADYDMQKDARGRWNVVIPGTEPGFQIYNFNVDGTNMLDPGTTLFFVNGLTSAIEYPAPNDAYYLARQVPHGDVREHWFHSNVAGSWRRMYVYTPPGYEKDADARYPVLYLQHGGGELDSEWTHAGRANFILDNLIAEGKARPMIVVMNTGFVTRPGQAPPSGGERGAGRRGAPGAGWASAFGDMLINEVIPDIDACYRTIADQQHRGMAGLSMGGMQTRVITLANLDKFSHIGIFSGGLITPQDVSNAPRFREKVKVLFMSCGSRERPQAMIANQEALNGVGISSVAYVSPDTAHEWQTWRRSLYQFAPLLFKENSATPAISHTQIEKLKVIDRGSSGPYKAIAVAEATLATHTVYRPEDMAAAVEKGGKLPVLVFANGGCSDTSITHERVLSEIASHGYIVIANGALQMTPGERRGRSTEATMLTDAIDWIAAQNTSKESVYYGRVDLAMIAAGGQSCGGAQVQAVAADPRIKTYMMFNSGMGEMSMAGASKESLKTLHGPIVYIVGGPSDVATANAQGDYGNISHVPVAFANLERGGHMGTFAEEFGGSFARMALKWLDWQLKGKEDNAGVFLASDLKDFPGWTMKAKNFGAKPKEITVTKDIAYRAGASRAWRLDMAVPVDSGAELRPALVIIHGGGWSAGSKSVDVYQKMMVDYARQGYVTINVDYRLTGEAPLPACIEDCKCAVRWLKAHAQEYRVDPKRIVAYGHSAGAHLVLMLALAGPEAGLEGDGGWNEYDSRIAAVAAGSPPTELPAMFGDPQKHSPLTYVTADAVPMLLIQGTADRIVRKEVTDRFVEKARSVGVKDLRYEVMEGGEHGVAYDSFLDRSTAAITRFFTDTVGR